MLDKLIFLLLLETFQPSYGTAAVLLPEQIVAEAGVKFSAPTLNSLNAPIKIGDSIAPLIEAKSVYSIDLETGTPLLINDIFTRRSLASISKLMTAMVILDNYKLDTQVIVGRKPTQQEGSRMWLREGEIITVENLLTGMLINSGNDAAVALAEFDSGNEKAFTDKMNQKAFDLDLKNTHFSNAKGFDEKGNYSTAFDIMIFARKALEYPFIKKTAAIKTAEVTSVNGKIKHPLESTNELLENQYFKVIGLKTGRTPAAGESFVSLAKAQNGHSILTVILDSPDRFKETRIVLDWILRNYRFQ